MSRSLLSADIARRLLEGMRSDDRPYQTHGFRTAGIESFTIRRCSRHQAYKQKDPMTWNGSAVLSGGLVIQAMPLHYDHSTYQMESIWLKPGWNDKTIERAVDRLCDRFQKETRLRLERENLYHETKWIRDDPAAKKEVEKLDGQHEEEFHKMSLDDCAFWRTWSRQHKH